MAKLLKIVSRILGGILEWILVIVIFIAFAVRTSAVQTYIGRLATDFLSKEMDAEFRIGKVDIYFFDRVALDDVFVRDQKGDTLASLESIKVQLSLLNLSANKIVLKNITLKEGRVGIDRDSLTGDYNYWFITDYFDSGTKTKKKKEPTDLTIRSLDIENVHLTYNDYRKTYNEFGIDYDHLDLRNVVLHAKDFSIRGKNYAFVVDHLSAKEKCGLDLKRLSTGCVIGEKGIFLSDLKINTFHSRLFAKKFNLVMDGLSRINAFEDSVTFDARIDSSIVNMYDVSLFAPALKGMRQKIWLQASLSQKVKDLKISDIDLRTGKKTIIRGNLLLPDFRAMEGSYLRENLEYAYIDLEDLQALRLPDNAAQQFLSFAPMISRLGYVEVKKTNLTGYYKEFVLSSQQIRTQLGTVHIDNGLLFTELKEGGYAFERSKNSNYDVYVDSFNLGKFIDDPMFGNVKGSLFVNGVVGQEDIIRLNELSGEIATVGFNDYNYSNISVTQGSYIDNVFEAKVAINDPHLELTFDGSIDLNNGQNLQFNVDIPKADLGQLNFVKSDSALLVTSFAIDLRGHNLSDYSGTIALERTTYQQDSNSLSIPQLNLSVKRNTYSDVFHITSGVAEIELTGKIDPKTIAASVNNSLVPYLSAYLKPMPFPSKGRDNNFFDLSVTVGHPEEVLALFAPGLEISSGSTILAHYDASRKEFSTDINSGEIRYNDILVRNLIVNQSALNGVAQAEIDAVYFELNDSLYVNALNVDMNGSDNVYNTQLKWNENMADPAFFSWNMQFAPNAVNVDLKPSYFSVKGQAWDIMNSAKISYSSTDISADANGILKPFAERKIAISHLVLERDVQFIAINGVLSDNEADELSINLNDLHLQEFSAFIDPNLDIAGNVSGDVRIATPFKAFRIDGDLDVKELVINKDPIGDVQAHGKWDAEKERVVLNGDLAYLKNETFDFEGDYYPKRKDDNINFKLDFKGMDMSFANAFIDPQVVRDIRGKLKGTIMVTGNAQSPTIDGKLNLENGNVKVELLGANFHLNGPIIFNGAENAFFIDDMPVLDDEGHRARLNASIFHENYSNWNCDLGFVIEDDKFLVLNTKYKEGTIYYGRAYVTGTANINFSDALTEILVDVKTEEGTFIDIPMYGNSEIKEGDFITFEKSGQQIVDAVKPEIDLSGVDLNLNFDVTNDAQLKLIFNDKTEDQVIVHGDGDIGITINSQNDLAMSGTYVVKDGVYNFAMGPVKKDFIIQEGGSIRWTKEPYNAALDLKTYKKVMANIADVGITEIDPRTSSNQEIYCILALSQTLDDPLITLNIEAPKATESGKAVIARIKSDKDELQKQFFSLLLLNKFVPLNGSASASGGFADVITNQINAFLGNNISALQLQVAYGSSETQQSESYEVTAQKAFGQGDSFVLRTTFGVSNSSSEAAQAQNQLIGDMSLEYLINKDGTFRVNIFNESNDNSILQDKSQGAFTQGVGLHYQEDFNTAEDFKLLQFVLDLFRKEKKIQFTSRRKLVKVNEEVPEKEPDPESPAILTDPEESEGEPLP